MAQTSLARLFQKHQQQILEEWITRQLGAASLRSDLLKESELREHSREFLKNFIEAARDALRQIRPRAIILDIALRGEESWNWLAELKADGRTREIPIIIATAVEDRGKGLTLGADAYCVKPLTREVLLGQLERVTDPEFRAAPAKLESAPSARVMIIDDEPAARGTCSPSC